MKRILIDGRWINKTRGLGKYVKELLYTLNEYPQKDFEITVLVPKYSLEKEWPNIKFIVYPPLPFPIWEQFLIPYVAKKYKFDKVHFPYNTKSLIMNFMRIKQVVTIHDVMFFYNKGKGVYQKIGNLYRKIIVLLFGNNQDVITISEKSKEEIKKYTGLNSKVIYTSSMYTLKKFDEKNSINGKLKNEKYFFAIGGISPHKNTEKMIKAFSLLRNDGYKLYIAGLPKKNYLSSYEDDERIIFTGWLSDKDIASYYKYARGILFPSLCEGYGLPITEAFCFYKPVLTSNISPMSELAGNAAILINPYSLIEMKQGIKKMKNDDVCKKIIEEIKKRQKVFSPKVMAELMYDIYGE